MRIDAHQHLWTEPFVTALASRRALPLIRREEGDLVLHLAGEPTSVIAVDQPAQRLALLRRDGVDGALIAPSSPLGIDGLDPAVARALLHAQAEGVREFGPHFRRWGAVPLADPNPAEVDLELDSGAVGLCLPAGAFADLDGLDRLEPILDRLEQRGAALFVHPGPNPWAGADTVPIGGAGPAWSPALTDYVTQMQRAWLTIVTSGQAHHPRLRILFALAAGGAPLLGERLAARGGPHSDPTDRRLFYDTSSHGPRALAALEALGVQLVHGSDRPVTPPQTVPSPARADELVHRLLGDFAPSIPPVTA
jgi:hypothetical protein